MGYAESIGKRLLGKDVEILTDSQYDTLEYAESSKSRASAIYGELLEVDDGLFVVNVTLRDGRSNIIYLKAGSVNSICEPKNGISVWDVYVCAECKMVK